MNRRLEIIVTNRDSAIRELDDFDKNKQLFVDTGFNDAQIEAMRKEQFDAWEKANNEFWEAFKFPLEVFSLENGDIPHNGEDVYVYDEMDGEWIKAEITQVCYDGALRFSKGLTVLGSPNNYESYVRWVRLPKLPND